MLFNSPQVQELLDIFLCQPERAVPEYDSSGCLCPDGCHRLSHPGILPGALVCLPRHCQQGQTLSREIPANLMVISVFTFSLAHWNCFFPYENTEVNSFKKDFSKYKENLVIIITQSSPGFMLHGQNLLTVLWKYNSTTFIFWRTLKMCNPKYSCRANHQKHGDQSSWNPADRCALKFLVSRNVLCASQDQSVVCIHLVKTPVLSAVIL